MKCFEFKTEYFVVGRGSQNTTLHILWDVNQNLICTAILVAGGHLVNIINNGTYFSKFKGIIVKLLHFIAYKKKLDQFCGNISNIYVNAYTNEKVYKISGKEFGNLEVSVVLIRKELYGIFIPIKLAC